MQMPVVGWTGQRLLDLVVGSGWNPEDWIGFVQLVANRLVVTKGVAKEKLLHLLGVHGSA